MSILLASKNLDVLIANKWGAELAGDLVLVAAFQAAIVALMDSRS